MTFLQSTKAKFNYPDTVIKEYQHWHLMLRLDQATLGSLILLCNQDVDQLHLISIDAITEMHAVIGEIEQKLKAAFDYQKINYMILMMVDPAVHFHIIPRYDQDKQFDGVVFTDPGWPALPDLNHKTKLTQEQFNILKSFLIQKFN